MLIITSGKRNIFHFFTAPELAEKDNVFLHLYGSEINKSGAEKLNGCGDMLIKLPSEEKLLRCQGVFAQGFLWGLRSCWGFEKNGYFCLIVK